MERQGNSAAEVTGTGGLQREMLLLTLEQMAHIRDQIVVRKIAASSRGEDWKDYGERGGIKLDLTADQVVELARGMGLDDEFNAEMAAEPTDSEDYEDDSESSGSKSPEEEDGEGEGAGKEGV